MSRRNQATVDQEVSFGIDEELVSTTDLRGVITYANDSFCKVSGYTINELKGKNHNMVRHPDMPPAAFGAYALRVLAAAYVYTGQQNLDTKAYFPTIPLASPPRAIQFSTSPIRVIKSFCY